MSTWSGGTSESRTAAMFERYINGRAPHVSPHDPAFGAVGDGITDDYTALQAAVDYVAEGTYGGGVILENRQYRTSRPVKMKRNTALYGQHHPHWFNDTTNRTEIKATTGWSGDAVVMIDEAAIIGGAGTHGGKLHGLLLNANDQANYALRIRGACIDWSWRDMEVINAALAGSSVVANGSSKPQELQVDHMYARSNTLTGFDWREAPDTRVSRCIAMSNGGIGWYLSGMSFSSFFNCGAEWNLDRGLVIGGNLPSDGLTFTDFKTDSNYNSGVYVGGCSDSRPICFTDLHCRRDGRNLGATYGVEIGTDNPNFSAPVVINGLKITVKPDDSGGTLYRPLNGLRIGAYADLVLINGSSYIWGVNNAITSGAAASVCRIGKPTALVTGNPGAQVRSFVSTTTATYTVD